MGYMRGRGFRVVGIYEGLSVFGLYVPCGVGFEDFVLKVLGYVDAACWDSVIGYLRYGTCFGVTYV